jgi:predicted RNA methylase
MGRVRYHTPLDIANKLAEYSRPNPERILDPAVGSGVLIAPLLSMCSAEGTIVDKDVRALRSAQRQLASFRNRLLAVHGDYLAEDCLGHRDTLYDCIVMNPPFAARTDRSVDIPRVTSRGDGRRVPVEAAFVVRALETLAPGGRLLGILPPSVVSNCKLTWLRQELLRVGTVRVVHELASRSFVDVEGPTFLFVFDRCRARNRILLYNHHLDAPTGIRLERDALDKSHRLDFRFYDSRKWFRSVVEATPTLAWTPLIEVADTRRGQANVPPDDCVLHSTSAKVPIWTSPVKTARVELDDEAADVVLPGDLVLSRVGRNCMSTAGIFAGPTPAPFSDCVLRIRSRMNPVHLLLMLRTVLGCPEVRELIQNGVGAKYIGEEFLRGLPLPSAIADLYPAKIAQYRRSIQQRDQDSMVALESWLSQEWRIATVRSSRRVKQRRGPNLRERVKGRCLNASTLPCPDSRL